MNAEDSLKLARRFIGLPLEKRQMFLAALHKEGVDFARFPIPAGVEAEDRQALSYAQQRMWFLWQLNPQSGAYNLPGAVRLTGRLNLSALEQAFASLVARHETLRTVFAVQADDSLLQVPATAPLLIEQVDFSTLPAAAREQAVAEAAERQSVLPFDLGTGPLLRVTLLKLAEQEHVLLLTLHHIVSDGWSMNVLIDEFIRCYDAFDAGTQPQLAALPIQYSDYALWQRRWLEAGEQGRQLDYWQVQLGDEHPVLELPTDHPRPAMPSYRGTRYEFAVDGQLAEQLRATAQKHNITLFMLLLGAFNVLLHRYTGQTDIRVGVPIANRNRAEIEGLIGFFVNTQVLRTQLDGQATVDELLRRIKETALGAQAHQDLPFERLVEALKLERSLSHTPLFQVMYNHQPQVADISTVTTASGLVLGTIEWQGRTTQFDLTLDTFEKGGKLHAALTYANDLFDAATIARMAQHWTHLLQGMVSDTRQRISDLPLLEQAEYQLIVHDWNRADDSFAQDLCIHELISQQVAATPDALAVTFATRQLTYGELDQQANRLAHKLIEFGVGPEVRVGVAMQRSEHLLVALLAVLKAGGACVPLDPDYPAERVAYMLEDSRALVLLTEAQVAKSLSVASDTQVLLMDSLSLAAYPISAPVTGVTPDNLAYVIYTSGSTGKPKGVAIVHRNVLALIDWSQSVYSRDDIQGVLASTSVCFDLSVWELFVTLANGGSLIIARNALELPQLPARDQVRLINTVPSAINALQRDGQIPSSVRIINLAGEPLKQSLVDALYRQPSVEHVFDLYGPSEDTTYSTWTRREAGGHANIGRPLKHTASYLLDADLQPVPQGVSAELYLSGAGITRGYLARPGLTAEKYVPNPFSSSGERLYRSGDLTRYQADGTLQYIGRIDHQVKVRGFRIELGEIEAQLLQQDAVRELAVLAQDGINGQQLVAYIVPTDPAMLDDLDAQAPLRESLKAALRQHLPDYMVPAFLLFLEQLPLTPNGKLDRKALPAVDGSQQQREHVAPRSAQEKSLAAIWQDVLAIDNVGLEDNFFELGGDSIVSMQVVSRARQAGILLSPKDLFQHQTIRSLAQAARSGEQQLIDQGPASGAVALAPVQRWFFEQAIPEHQHWNQSLLLVPREALNVETLDRALEHLLTHHDSLRLRYQQTDSGWQQAYAAPTTDSVLWQHQAQSVEQLSTLCDEAQRSLDLHNGPLLRALLVSMADGSQRLLLVVHHLAVDGVSWRVLLEDLQHFYNGGTALAKTSSYQRWVTRLQAHLPAFERSLGHWQNQLQDAPDDLPCERPNGALENRFEHKLELKLDSEQTRKLLQQAPAAYRTQVNDLLLTALARAVCLWSGQGSALIQLEGHGREDLFDDVDLTRTVGWFTSLFPVNLKPAADLGASIKTIKEQLRSVPDKGLGYGALRYLGSAQARAELAALPQPRITFNYLGQFDRQFEAGALFTPSTEGNGIAQDPSAPLGNWLVVEGQVYGGELSLSWGFSREMFDTATVQRLADVYAQELIALIEHCCTVEAAQATPSDFPLARIDQAQLDGLPLAIANLEDLYPLSPMQQGMLFHTLYEPQVGAYISQLRLDIGGLDIERFTRAWQAAVERHDSLRSSYHWQGLDTAHQAIARQVALPLQVLEATDTDALADAERAQGFELGMAPLFRLKLVRTGADAWHLIHTSHHILMDGWSNAQLLAEVIQHYAAGQPLPVPAGQYRDYLGWLQQQSATAGEQFWKAALAPLQAPTLLAEALRPPVDATGSEEHRLTLDCRATQHLADFARQHKVTLNTLLQAAWSLLLQRYTGQDCVVFGATVAGRSAPLPGIEQQLGLFINTLPLVCAMKPDQTVSQWLGELQGLNLAMREFEHVPLYDIQGWAGQQGAALFDSLLVFENFPVAQALKQGAPAGLSFANLHNHERTHYPLTLGIELGEGLGLEFSYDAARFSATQIAQLSANLQHLLMQLVASPEAALGSLELLDVDGQNAVLAISQPPAVELSTTLLAHQQIAAQAAATPDALALQVDGHSLSYGQLDAQADHLAQRLIDNGAGPGKRVGLAVRRGPQLIVSLLAVLKSGAAYVPLDPKYPTERLAYMIEDSRLDVLLHESGLLEDVPNVQRLTLEDTTTPVGAKLAREEARPAAEDLAYIIYTSGSTGQPKGVAITHAALREFCQTAADYSRLSPTDRVLQFATFSFDGFVEQCFPAFCVGATLIMRGDDLWDAGRLATEIVEQGVTVADLPAAYWFLLARECASGVVPSLGDLRQVHVGGEAMSVEGLRLWHQAGLSHVRLLNTYGPTEATVVSSVHECRLADASDAFGIPIGRGIPGRALYVLDAAGQLLPADGVGELCIGAPACLAQSYFDRPALTAERFLPDPFAREPGARLYRSGDLARYNGNGDLEYVGRIDHQVKIRGFRIEMGEIEACLQARDEVREAAVIAQDGTQLVAYIVASSTVVLQAQYLLGLKAVLQRSLPEYMVPNHMVLLDRLPLNNNGKLDRKALPRVEAGDVQRDFVAPMQGLETQLAQIWQAVLQVEKVGRDDNFFELGGHSLLVLQVISRVRQQLQLELSVSNLFSAANLAEFAKHAAQANLSGQPPLQRASDDQPRLLSYAQQRQWILWQLDPHSAAYNIPAALRLKGPLNRRALRTTFAQLQVRHETLRTTFEQKGQQARPVVHVELPLQFNEQPINESAINTAVAAEIARPFDLRHGPLWRCLLLHVSAEDHVLVLTVHHIAADGWSMQVMVDEFSALYQAAVQERAANLQALPVAYSDYARWQRDWLEAGEGARQLAWWRDQLAGSQAPLALPSELTRPVRRSERGASLALNVDRQLLAGLRERAQEQQVTLFMLLLASFQTLLHRQSGQSGISVGVPSAGRSRLETEGLIGFFINTQVLRAEIDGQQPFSALLQQVKQTALDAQAHQDLPFEQLVDALQPDRSLNHSPLFQVLYNHQQKLGASVERAVADLQVERLHWQQHTAQFDLVLDTQEQGDELDANLSYATDLYDEASMQRFAEQWLNLLRAVVENPQQRVAELPLLQAPQYGELIQHWNPTFEAQAQSPTLHQLFEAQAAQRPHAIALTCEGEQMSYAALNAEANRLARKLREQGVGPEVRVGIATERAIPLVVGLLAILKAGGAYVPLDPQYPVERLSYMIDDSGIGLLLTQSHLIDGLPAREGVQVLDLTALQLDRYSADNLAPLASPDNLAYVIYTSGSTGRPKGALLSHGNVGRLLTATAGEFNFGADDVWTLFHSYAFDFSVWELFGALCTGGRLVIVPYYISREPQAFHRLLCDEGVTVLNQTPTAFRQLLPIACASPRSLALRQVIFGGEALEVASLRSWFERFGDQQPTLVNMYGITETTVHVTYRAIRLADLDAKAQSPIGLPIRDLRWYLLDSQLQPVPVGVAGELYIAGAGLARGYHGRSGLTAERFVPSPFDAAQRLYRSGDLARQRADGSIDYLGRIDQQVKIRGFRIELGEIEAAVLAQPGVRQAVISVHVDDGGPQLCAYVVAELTSNDPIAWRDTLRAALSVDLPDYMVPRHWLLLDALPLTSNGKLDRKALPLPDAETWQRPFEAPEGELEQQLAAIWAEVLGVARIGRRDNFFELGGHSLLAAQASARVELELGIELPLRVLFESNDLQAYAANAWQHAPIDNDARLDALESLLDEMEIN
ncbi:non-ribosomal peptide synthetase [Pseudomonas umsongensis]|uniref:Non-ribosomal peptide synthetase n=1 Tax=Pseudomonas umsongensis TaxID=198618 RepID=A0ABX4DNR4_9PSED|nr:non-ribosomal peptide synthetase [Pseudomonas umsongensis]OXR28395.1 non-ribosomal peptide synthetase [Pseudomonas umsongensis]SDT58916.1 non-ribosomal peptide synthase domain TIGR01720/amino acid adenylation domain-containing protein [Pseudomonas umsongensis]